MDLQLKDKVVLITGASKGIGLACARAFVAEGARLALAARSADVLQAAAAELRATGAEALAVPADLIEPAQAEQLAHAVTEQFGPIDVLVNSAGAARPRRN